MRFNILFAAACLSFGATVQAAVIPNGDDNGLVAQAQSIQGNKQNKDYQPQGGIAIAKRQFGINLACQVLTGFITSATPTLESVVQSCTSTAGQGTVHCGIVNQVVPLLGESGIGACDSAATDAGADTAPATDTAPAGEAAPAAEPN